MKIQAHEIPCRAAALISIYIIAVSLSAQSVPAPDEVRLNNGVVVMSPFVVTSDKDVGYIAADTLSASRLSTNLLMTPGSIEVMTRDLLDDLGVINIDEASGWLTNSRPYELGAIEGNSINQAGLASTDSAVNVSLRGLGGTPSTRNYFTSASTPKEYNVERVESSRGPNAILYGEGGPGGGVNYMTKRAKNRNFTTLRFRFDTDGTANASLDFNRKLLKQLDFRYNLNALDKGYYIDDTRFTEIGNAFSIVYQPFRQTTISFDADITRSSRPVLIMSYADNYSKWDGQPVTGKLTSAQATARGLRNWASSPFYTWIEGVGMLDLAGYASTTGYGLPVNTEQSYGDSVFPGVSKLSAPAREFNANPSDIDVTDRAGDFQLAIDQTFGSRLFMQLAGQYSKYEADGGNFLFSNVYIDPVTILPDGSPNPNFGKPFSQTYVGRDANAERLSKTVRFVVAYPLKFWGGTTTISAFLQHQEESSDTIYSDLHIHDPKSTKSITDGSSLIRVNRYWDNLPRRLPDFRAIYDTVDVPTAHSVTDQRKDAFEIAVSASYLNDRLSFIGGFRRDRSRLGTQNGDSASRDSLTGQFIKYTKEDREAYNNTMTYGIVYFPINYLGVYANHAEGFTIQTIANKRIDGSFANANVVPASDNSFGIRFNIASGIKFKIVGTVGPYYVKQTKSAFGISVSSINRLWNNHSMEANYIHTFAADPLSTSGDNSITSTRSYIGKGWEASIVMNIGKSFKFTINGALPKTKQSDVGADFAAYVNQHMPQWETWANMSLSENPYKAADMEHVISLKQRLEGFQDGRSQNLTYKYRFNAFGIYTFDTTIFKGLRVGAGAQFHGPSIVGNDIGKPYDYVYSEAYCLMTANLGYSFKLGKLRMNLQMNIDNLLDYDDSIVNGLLVHSIGTEQYNVPYGRKFVYPRVMRCTVTIPF